MLGDGQMDEVRLSQYFNSMGMDSRRAKQYSNAIENYTKAINFYPSEVYFYNRAQAQLFIMDNPRVNAFLALDDFMVYLLLSYRKYKRSSDITDIVTESRYFEITYNHCRMANKCFNIAWNRFSVDEKTLNLLMGDLIADNFDEGSKIEFPQAWNEAFDSFDAFFGHIKRLMTIENEFNNYFSSSRKDVKKVLDDTSAKAEMLEFIELMTDMYYNS